jgi:hypothetical protein
MAYIINKCNIAHRFYLLSLSIVYLTNEVTLANFILRKNLYLYKILKKIFISQLPNVAAASYNCS